MTVRKKRCNVKAAERVIYNYNIKLTEWLFFSKEVCLDSLKYGCIFCVTYLRDGGEDM